MQGKGRVDGPARCFPDWYIDYQMCIIIKAPGPHSSIGGILSSSVPTCSLMLPSLANAMLCYAVLENLRTRHDRAKRLDVTAPLVPWVGPLSVFLTKVGHIEEVDVRPGVLSLGP